MSQNLKDDVGLFTTDGHLTDLTVERWIDGELEGDPVAAHLDACGPCCRRVDAVRADTAAFLEGPLAAPPWLLELERAAPRVQAPPAAPPATVIELRPARRARLWPVIGGLAAMAAAIALVLALGPLSGPDGSLPAPSGPDDGIRVKGRAFGMEVYANGEQGTRNVRPDGAVYPGERVGFRILPREQGWVMIVGIDDKGNGYRCYPQGSETAARVEARPEGVTLDEAMELDEVLGHERLVALLCPRPFTYAPVAATLEREAAKHPGADLPPLLEGCQQHEIRLSKQAREP